MEPPVCTAELYFLALPPLCQPAREVKSEPAAAAKSLQSCRTLCDPIDGSPPGSPVPGILQARTLEWVAISFSNAWKWKVKVKSLRRVQLFVTPWTAAYQAPPSMGFSRQVLEWGAIAFSEWSLRASLLPIIPENYKNPAILPLRIAAWPLINSLFRKLRFLKSQNNRKSVIFWKWSESCSVVSDSL